MTSAGKYSARDGRDHPAAPNSIRVTRVAAICASIAATLVTGLGVFQGILTVVDANGARGSGTVLGALSFTVWTFTVSLVLAVTLSYACGIASGCLMRAIVGRASGEIARRTGVFVSTLLVFLLVSSALTVSYGGWSAPVSFGASLAFGFPLLFIRSRMWSGETIGSLAR